MTKDLMMAVILSQLPQSVFALSLFNEYHEFERQICEILEILEVFSYFLRFCDIKDKINEWNIFCQLKNEDLLYQT